MPLCLYSTLTRRKDAFKPLKEGEVRIYSCGPTVYSYAHIGNFRAYLFEDLLCRVLRTRGYRVRQVMNITDVDDKTILGAEREGKALQEFTRKYKDAFFKDLKTLSIEPAECYPMATEHVPAMIKLIERLVAKDLAYEADGSIYYRVNEFAGYGKLSRMDTSQVRPQGRLDQDEYEKEEVRDFCLWKKAKEGEPSWKSPFGPGRPGWHIECSAMSMQYLGEEFDIHTGGEDNIFPHHENEIAQSEGATGRPFVRTWMHCKFLVVDGHKMSKSKGNWFTLRDLTKRDHSPTAIRYLLLAAHYRSVLNFTLAGLEQAHRTLEHLHAFLKRLDECKDEGGGEGELLSRIEDFSKKFDEGLDDDLNVPAALAALFEMVSELNKAMDEKTLGEVERTAAREAFIKADRVLGLLEPDSEEIDTQTMDLIKERNVARKKGDYKRADLLREKIHGRGFMVEDTDGKTRWHKRHK